MNNDRISARRSPSGALLDIIDRILEALCRFGTMLGALLVIATMIVVGYGVLMRYVFGRPQIWTDELVSLWLVAIVTLGAADVLRRNGHIGIDLVTSSLPPFLKAVADLFGLAAVILLSVVLTLSGWEMVEFSWSVDLLSDGYLELPMWIPQSLIPIGFTLMGLAALHRLIQRFRGGLTGDKT
ncbi:MAG: TRAP transporter small permease [Desulfofustis sp.]|nr:TRAP transporter small permease [Desulfofustis sp.]